MILKGFYGRGVHPHHKELCKGHCAFYKMMHVADGNIYKYKSRFMGRGFSQKEGMDYKDTFPPVIRLKLY